MNETKATWTGGLRFVYTSASGHALVSDAPTTVGGGGTATTPMELLLLGLIGCTGVDVASILQGMREHFTGLEVTATAERAEEHPRVYKRIHLTYIVTGDVNEKKLKRAIRLSETKYCSASAMLAKTAEITSDFEIRGH